MGSVFISAALLLLMWSVIANRKKLIVCSTKFELKRQLPDLTRWLISSLFLTIGSVIVFQLSYLAVAGIFLLSLLVTMLAANLVLHIWN